MTRVARQIDLSEWLTRTEERLSTAERRLAAAQRPAVGTTQLVYGPNLLPNPGFEGTDGAASIAGWQNLQQGLLISGSGVLAGSWSYRMQHSAQQPVITREKRSINVRPYAWRNYTGAGVYKPAQGSDGVDHAWQGQFDATDGNTRSLLWWDPAGLTDLVGSIPGDWVTADILIYWEHWYWSEGGVSVLGVHTLTAVPAVGAAQPVGNQTPNLLQGSWPGRYMWGSQSFIAIGGIADRIRDGTFRGLTLGPGPNTQPTYYGYARPYDMQLKITYWKTTNISIGGNSSEVRSNGVGVSGGNLKWNAQVTIQSSVAATATLGVWWRNAGGTVTDTDCGTFNLGAGATQPLSATTAAAFSNAAVDVGVYVKVTGSPPSDGAGGTVPWNYTVDQFVLRQQIAG
jgi:hypothetical protein